MTARRPARPLRAALSVAAIVAFAGISFALASGHGRRPAAPPAATPPTLDGRALFAGWPAAKPDAVLVLTGQTYGYIQPCGCSRPQLGGLERRYNFIKSLKDRGWPVAAIDLGDVPPYAGVVPEQVALKYATSMKAMQAMGYLAVGLGNAEFNNGVYTMLAAYSLQKEQAPFVLAGNVGGLSAGKVTPRAEAFPGPGPRPMVGSVQVDAVGKIQVGIAGVVGPSVQKAVAKLGPGTLVGFTAQADALAAAVKELADHKDKPQLRVLLYQGTADEAKVVAANRPEFQVILCLSSDSTPPSTPEIATGPGGQRILVVQVGQKGRYVGALGVFKKPDGSLDLRYQLVPLTEYYVTPGDDEAARKINPVLPILEGYAAQVKARNLLGKFPQNPHPAQIQAASAGLIYVGSEKCMDCHPAEYKKWKHVDAAGHAHSVAMRALEKVAHRPGLRNFDGECVVCHTVGFGYKTGYRDDITTPTLKNVGCESCHGPGSGHSADPKNPKLLALQSPWRRERTDRLPAAATMTALAQLSPADQARALKPSEVRMVNAVFRACYGCHDTENDPRFDIFTYWPKIAHGGGEKK